VAKKLDFSNIAFGDTPIEYRYYPSSIISLNQIMGGKGLRGGTITQLLAEPGHGKTTLALDFLAQGQKSSVKEVEVTQGKTVRKINALFVDLERSFDPVYAAKIGVDLSKLLVLRPSYAEQCLAQVEWFLTNGLQLIVFDSVPAMVTKDEFEKEMDDPARMAGASGLLSRWVIRLVGMVHNADAMFIFINQYRANLSPMARTEKKPFGARSLRYYCNVILELVRIRNEDERTIIQATVTKNKQSGEGNRCEYTMLKGRGLAPEYDVLALALEYGIITKAGAWYEYAGKKAQGLDNCIQHFDLGEIRKHVEAGG
jgi:recombination protein RecA